MFRKNPNRSYTKPGGSLHFLGGNLTIAADPALAIADNLFVNIRFFTDTLQNQNLIRKGTVSCNAYLLSLIEQGGAVYVSAQVTTANGTYTLTSDTAINLNRWYIAGLRVRNGQLELGVNAERKTVAINGPLINLGTASPTYIPYMSDFSHSSVYGDF